MAEQSNKAKDNKNVMRLLRLSMNAQLKDNLKRIRAGKYIENCNY